MAVPYNGGKMTYRRFKNLLQDRLEDLISADRPALAKALSLCRIHNAVLLVAKLDRLARNVAFISSLMESGMEFVAVDLPQANKLTVHVMAAMAEYEAQAVSTRTKAALAAAKARGVKLGGNRWNIQSVALKGNAAGVQVRVERARKRASDLLPVINAVQSEGAASLRQIAAVLNERGIKAPRGGEWSAVQVKRVLTDSGKARGVGEHTGSRQ